MSSEKEEAAERLMGYVEQPDLERQSTNRDNRSWSIHAILLVCNVCLTFLIVRYVNNRTENHSGHIYCSFPLAETTSLYLLEVPAPAREAIEYETKTFDHALAGDLRLFGSPNEDVDKAWDDLLARK